MVSTRPERRTPEIFPVAMPDSSTSGVRIFAPASSPSDATPGHSAPSDTSAEASALPAWPLVVIWPGFGMGARYYDPIAWELADRGFPVASGELRGQGSSTAKASRSARWGYHHMASGDYPLTIAGAKEHFGLPENYPTVLLCHSMGGQIASLFLARPEAEELNVVGVLGVGSGSPYWGGFESPERYRLRYGTYLVRGTVGLLGYQPAGHLDLAGYGRQAGPHLREWFRYAHTNRLHKLEGADMDYEAAKARVNTPVLLTRFTNDKDCPVASAQNLADDLGAATVEELDGELGHNRWAREPAAVADRLERFVGEL